MVPQLIASFAGGFTVLFPSFLVIGFLFFFKHFEVFPGIYYFILFYFFSLIGISVGSHRFFAHRSFETKEWMKVLFIFFAHLTWQGPVFWWVAIHRHHHSESDEVNDVHSPLKGLWNAHCGWMFQSKWIHSALTYILKGDLGPFEKHVIDLKRDSGLVLFDRFYPINATFSMAAPAIFMYLIHNDMNDFYNGLFWGGALRIVMTQHFTWAVNSLGHFWGTRDYETEDNSRNSFILGLLTFGEGWHNNHHAQSGKAAHGHRWWQVDFGWYFIWVLERLRVVEKVKI